MHIWPSLLVSLFLLLVAVGLIVGHCRTWRWAQRHELEAAGLQYRRRQFRRRMQTSALLAALAVAIFVGQLIHGPPLAVLVFWAGVLLVLGWVFLLAVVDIWATKHHFGRLRQTYRIEEAKLQAELRRIQATRGNGKARNKDHGSQPPG